MKGKHNFGYKLLFLIGLVVAILNTTARGYRPFFAFFAPAPDTTSTKDSTAKADSLHKLRFPIYDKMGDPVTDYHNPGSIDLKDPKNEEKSIEFDPQDSNRYEFKDKLGDNFLRNPHLPHAR